MEGLSEARRPSQILVSIFYTSIEPYFRLIKEAELGFLEYTGDEVEPHIIPRLDNTILNNGTTRKFPRTTPFYLPEQSEQRTVSGSQHQLLPFLDRIPHP